MLVHMYVHIKYYVCMYVCIHVCVYALCTLECTCIHISGVRTGVAGVATAPPLFSCLSKNIAM